MARTQAGHKYPGKPAGKPALVAAGTEAPSPDPPPPPETQPKQVHYGSKDNPEVRALILSTFNEIDELQAQRSEINADMKAARERLVARGLNKQAIKDAERYYRLGDSNREGYDISVGIVRKAFDLPIQIDMLDIGDRGPDASALAADEGAAAAEGEKSH